MSTALVSSDFGMRSSAVWATWMLPGPMRKGCPQEPLKLGISVVKATTVVGRSSRDERWTAGQKRTSRASILNAAAMRATAGRVGTRHRTGGQVVLGAGL